MNFLYFDFDGVFLFLLPSLMGQRRNTELPRVTRFHLPFVWGGRGCPPSSFLIPPTFPQPKPYRTPPVLRLFPDSPARYGFIDWCVMSYLGGSRRVILFLR